MQAKGAIENTPGRDASSRSCREDANSSLSASFFREGIFSRSLQTLWRAIIRFTCLQRGNTVDERVVTSSVETYGYPISSTGV